MCWHLFFGHEERTVAFIARNTKMAAVGLAEASLRLDFVNECKTSPVAFLERHIRAAGMA